MRILVTGGAGFSGRALLKALENSGAKGNKIFLCGRSSAEELANDSYRICDLSDAGAVLEIIEKVNPEQIYHLSGSFSNNYELDHASNVLSSKNLLDSLLKLKINPRILLIGSAAEYGQPLTEDGLVDESHPLDPVNIYGLTKKMQTNLLNYYVNLYGLNIVMARTFNLLGKGASEKLFIGRIYSQISRYKNGEIGEIILGNLAAERDYIEIQDAVQSYINIMSLGKSGEVYNVGSGKPISMYELLNKILLQEGVDIKVIQIQDNQGIYQKKATKIYADIKKYQKLLINNV